MTEQQSRELVQIRIGERGLILNTLDEMTRWAEGVKNSGLAPKTLSTASQIIVATQYGLELGLTPMAALNSIAVIGNKPSLYGDAALALVRRSGLCEYVKEWIEGEGDEMVAYCEAKRKDQVEPVKRSFSVADAKTAGLWKKTGPWTTHPKRMLQYKARAFCLRDLFSDVLMGLHLYEELQGEDDFSMPVCDTPPRATRRTKPAQDVQVTDANPQPAENTDGSTEAEPAGTTDPIPMMYQGLRNQFAVIAKVGAETSDEQVTEMFRYYCADALACPPEDVSAEKFTVPMLQKVQTALNSFKAGA
jgi:hypothetical protein